MIKITSKTNDRVKHLKKLLDDRDYRYEQKEFAVEGVRALDGLTDVPELYVREGAQAPSLKARKIYNVGKDIFNSISSTENSQGVIAVVKLSILPLASVEKNSKYLLDRLQDPGNTGTIIRTARAFGFKGVIIAPGCVDPFSPKATRAAASALWKVDVVKIENITDLAGYCIIAAGMEGEDAGSFNWPGGFLLAIGNEAEGLSEEIKRMAARTVAIPMNKGIQSLNAAVSAGILMYLAGNR